MKPIIVQAQVGLSPMYVHLLQVYITTMCALCNGDNDKPVNLLYGLGIKEGGCGHMLVTNN